MVFGCISHDPNDIQFWGKELVLKKPFTAMLNSTPGFIGTALNKDIFLRLTPLITTFFEERRKAVPAVCSKSQEIWTERRWKIKENFLWWLKPFLNPWLSHEPGQSNHFGSASQLKHKNNTFACVVFLFFFLICPLRFFHELLCFRQLNVTECCSCLHKEWMLLMFAQRVHEVVFGPFPHSCMDSCLLSGCL